MDFFRGPRGIQSGRFRLGVEKTTRKALRQVLLHLKTETFHCLELTEVAFNRFLGLPTGSVSAHSRHFQESMFLSRAQCLAEWNRAILATPQLAAPLATPTYVAGTEPPVTVED